MQSSLLDKLIWVLIFGGMLSFTLGLSMLQGGGTLGWTVAVAGAVAVVVGVVLIVVRSHRPNG